MKTIELIILIMLLAIMAEVYVLARPRRRTAGTSQTLLIDTSVLMDGRVVDIAKAGFFAWSNCGAAKCAG